MRRYTILLITDPEEGGYTVEVPALAGCVTEGDTLEEALDNAREAIRGWIKDAELHGEPVPAEDVPLQVATVEV